MYGDFADVYDRLMDDVDYPGWASHYLALAGLPREGRASLCECGCGTGSMAILWAIAGYRVTGVDRSESMLRVATDKARAAGVSVAWVRQDMRALALHAPVDAIFAPCDAVNYLICERDVRAFLDAAVRQLKPGGTLAFDLSTRYKLEHVLADGFFGEDRGDLAYLWQNRWDGARTLIQMDMTFFVRESGGLYRRFDERHEQRAHEASEIRAWLAEAGFCDARAFGEYTFESPAADAQRIHWIARKKMS